MNKSIIYIILLSCLSFGCEKTLTKGFNQKPMNKISPLTAFNDESGLQLYTTNFYRMLPSGNSIIRGDGMSPFMTRRSVPTYLVPGAYDSKEAGGWSWGWLRTINYFIVNAPNQARKSGVREDAIENQLGTARFFRAWFYFDKVKRFGKVPWYSHPLDPADSAALYKTQDSRTLIMDSVLSDLNYAIGHLNDDKSQDASVVTKWTALAFKSRVCLFEGTYRKYHPNLNLQGTADDWLEDAKDAAKELMVSDKYSIHTNSSNPEMSYRDLFIDQSGHPPIDETILSYNCNTDLNVFNDANWYFTSPTYGIRLSLDKRFVNTYLDIDGSRFTDKSNYETMPFSDEVKNRDLRLQQTIRMGDYTRADGSAAPPDFSATESGYESIKFVLDATTTDGSPTNDNSIPIIRYAEVLLNYAEAKAELGTFTSTDWDNTIKLLRQRAGISNPGMPTTPDTYLQQIYYPNISDPVLLEIRREREIELAYEGFAFDDIRRWKRGELLELPYKGMYVPAMNTELDLNGDGKPDVSFVSSVPANKTSGVVYVEVDNSSVKLSEGDHGNILWRTDKPKDWEDYKYIYPVPHDEIVLNPKLDQSPGWE